MQERRKARDEMKAVEAKVVLGTFEECAEAYIQAKLVELEREACARSVAVLAQSATHTDV